MHSDKMLRHNGYGHYRFQKLICASSWSDHSVVAFLLEHHNSNNEVSLLFAKRCFWAMACLFIVAFPNHSRLGQTRGRSWKPCPNRCRSTWVRFQVANIMVPEHIVIWKLQSVGLYWTLKKKKEFMLKLYSRKQLKLDMLYNCCTISPLLSN